MTNSSLSIGGILIIYLYRAKKIAENFLKFLTYQHNECYLIKHEIFYENVENLK